MAATMPTRARRSLAVTIVGVATLLLAAGYAVTGTGLILVGTGWLLEPAGDPWKQIATLFGMLTGVLLAIGVVFVVLAMLVLLAALGLLRRQFGGLVLALGIAVLVILLGLLWLSGVENIVDDATELAIGAAQILYGIVVLIILTAKRAEFGGQRA